LGENGCGKSTVLRAIALLLSGSDAMPELLGDPSTWIRLGEEACLMHADLVTARGEERQVELRIQRDDKIIDVFNRNAETLNALDSALEYTPRNYLVIGYGVSRRLGNERALGPAVTATLQKPRAQNVATLFFADAAMNPLESWAMDLHYRRGEVGLQMVKSALGDLLPGVTFAGIDKAQRQLMFNTADGIVPLSLLSDGYQNMAAWCGDLLYRITETFSDRRDPFSARGLLLLDELDLHLHPVWQRQLVGYLTEKLPNFQIIATTHSPLTVHQAGEGELFMLQRAGSSHSPALSAFPGEPRSLMLHQLLVSPIFGLGTVDSTQVEALRNEYKALQARDTATLTRAEKRRLDALSEELADLPDWSAGLVNPQQQTLLNDIQQALQSDRTMGKPKAATKVARKTSRKAKATSKTSARDASRQRTR
jgi:recombinational DNA repair ATPase RecF